jgi:hypothetical protein
VIGNPPYVRQESLTEFKAYFLKHYDTYHSTADLYVFFFEKGLSVLRIGGLFGIIVSSSYLRASYAKPLRHYLHQNHGIKRVIDFGGIGIFEDAKDTYVSIPIIEKGISTHTIDICRVDRTGLSELESFVKRSSYQVPSDQFNDDSWSLENETSLAIHRRIASVGQTLGDYIHGKIYRGLLTGLNEAFELNEQQYREIINQLPKCSQLIKSFIGGQDIRRYQINDVKRYLIAIPAGWTRISAKKYLTEREAWNWLVREYEPIAIHLEKYLERAKKRQDKGDFWWELRPCDYYQALESPKIIYPDIAKFPRFCFDISGIYIANTAYCLGSNDLYLLGILNSKLFWFAISNISIPFGVRAGEYRYRLIYQYMEKVPIRTINFSDPADKAAHDRMVSLIECMLSLHKQSARTPQEKEMLQREIESTDEEIDALVYQLYGLTEDEIRIVEEA